MVTDELVVQVREQYAKFVNPGLAKLMAFAGFGVEVHAEGCYLYDEEGKKYLDCLGGYGVFSLGHRHPRVVEAVKRQIDTMPLSAKVFFNPVMAQASERLADCAPGDLSISFFSNSGAEAVEAALKFARAAARRPKFVSTEGSYHGKTMGALSVTGRKKYREPFEPLLPGAEFVEFGDFNAMRRSVDSDTAAVIVEVVQGEGGIHVAPPGYLSLIRELCDKSGALMIVDEVQTGLGRTGKMFGCDHEGIAGDIMTLAKCLGGGVVPIGATLITPEVSERVFGENPLVHTSTFGGNPMACAAAIATLDVIREEGLVENSARVGKALLEALRQASAKFPDLVSEVRGIGLMIGAEFRMDDVGELLIAQMVKRGMVAAYTLNNRRVIRFEPPLIISESEALQAAEIFESALAETAELLAAFG